jgi:deoxyribodipyrimidine photolyase
MQISELIIQLHNLATETNSIKIKLLADELAKIGNELYTRENTDKLCSHEEAEAFALKRDYTYTDFPEWKSNRDIV